MKNGQVSHWMAASEATAYPRLGGDRSYDVCIVGGGMTGLWAAYYLKRLNPDIRVAVLEAKMVGYGASGRNGGWASHLLPGKAERYASNTRYGVAGVRRLQRAMVDAIDGIERAAAEEGMDADLRRTGNLVIARGPAALKRMQTRFSAERKFGMREDESVLLSARETRERIAVDDAVGSFFTGPPIRMQPAKLVKELARVCAGKGVDIYENTAATAVSPGSVRTDFGTVSCETILMCTEGYAHEFPIAGFRPAVVAINSSMIITQPVSDAQWDRIGWGGFELFSDAAHVHTYAQRTEDGRIAIGGRGVPYRFNSATGTAGVTAQKTVDLLLHRLREYFPSAEPFEAVHAWSGCLGVSRDWCASVSLDRRTGIGNASGFTGHGVTATHLAGQILAEKTVNGVSQYDDTPLVDYRQPRWEPEPLRWIGINATYKLFSVADPIEERRDSDRTSVLAKVGAKVSGM